VIPKPSFSVTAAIAETGTTGSWTGICMARRIEASPEPW
jgi:hypothetical protein